MSNIDLSNLNLEVDWNNVARSMISRIDVETAYGPPISLDDPFAPGPPNPYLQELKPKVTMHLKHGQKPVVVAPYGDPPKSKWPVIEKTLMGVGFVVAAGGLWWLGRKFLR